MFLRSVAHCDAIWVSAVKASPLVVLVGPDTVSFGEVFSGILKDQGRATLIGETTDGNVEILGGLSEDETVVVVGHSGLRNGSKVLASSKFQDSFTG